MSFINVSAKLAPAAISAAVVVVDDDTGVVVLMTVVGVDDLFMTKNNNNAPPPRMSNISVVPISPTFLRCFMLKRIYSVDQKLFSIPISMLNCFGLLIEISASFIR